MSDQPHLTSKDLTSEIREALHERSHWSAVEAASKFRSLLSYALVEIERLNADVDLVKAVSRADARSVLPWGDGTREMLIELRDWLRAKMPCNAGDCCNELRSWIDRVDKDITSHSPAASAHEPCPECEHREKYWQQFDHYPKGSALPPEVAECGCHIVDGIVRHNYCKSVAGNGDEVERLRLALRRIRGHVEMPSTDQQRAVYNLACAAMLPTLTKGGE